MSAYTKLIKSICKCSESDVILVERAMRAQHPVLDNIRRPEFDKLAKIAYSALSDPEFRKLMENDF